MSKAADQDLGEVIASAVAGDELAFARIVAGGNVRAAIGLSAGRSQRMTR